MVDTNKYINFSIFFFIFSLFTTTILASDEVDQRVLPSSISQGINYTTIATETPKSLSEVPASVTIITEEDILKHGIHSLSDVMKEVPGIYSAFSFASDNFIIRGISQGSNFNTEVMIMLDGIPQSDYIRGDQRHFISRVPIANIKRIEIIRGSGSALYGADAVFGVINIVTKTNEDYEDSEIRVGIGSYNEKVVSTVVKSELAGYDTLFSLEYSSTDGHEPIITEDGQTHWDNQFSAFGVPPVSFAPSAASTSFDEINTSYNVFNNFWRTRFRYREHEKGIGAGLIDVLDPVGFYKTTQKNIDVIYDNLNYTKDWRLKSTFSYTTYNFEMFTRLTPPGSFLGTFPEGTINDREYKENKVLLNASVFRTINRNHDVMLGVGLGYFEATDIDESRNFILLPEGFPTLNATGSIDQLSPSERFMLSQNRSLYYITAHDDWLVLNDLRISGGARYDHFSDFNNSFNPRIAFIYNNTAQVTSKLIYTSAIRSPTFQEMYSTNNPESNGFSNIKPVKMNSTELSIEKHTYSGDSFKLAIFYQEVHDSIESVLSADGTTQIFSNVSNPIYGYGGEIQAKYQASDTIDLNGSLSIQRNKRKEELVFSEFFHSGAPQKIIYLGVNWETSPEWNIYANAQYTDEITRGRRDRREFVGERTLVDLTTLYRPLGENTEVTFSVRNVLDVDAVEGSSSFKFIPNDIPLPERNYFAEFRFLI